MNALATSPIVDALARALLHFFWQGAVIALVLACVRPALRAASSRYAAACAALLTMAAAPAVTFVVLYTPAAGLPVPSAAAIALEAPPLSGLERLRLALLVAWLGGALVLSLRLAGGLVVLRRLAHRDTFAVGAALRGRAERLAQRLGVAPAFALLASPHVAVPLTFGWLKPVVLVPAAALTSMPPEFLEALLAHEIAHLKRRDFLVNVLQTVIESVLFHHPAVWWVSAQIREEREYACDDLAAGVLGDRVAYASALASIAQSSLVPSPAMASLSTGGPLVRRIRRILAPSPVPSRARLLAAPLALLLTAAPVVALAVSAAFAPPEKGETIAIRWLPPSIEPWRPQIIAAALKHGIDPDLLAILVLVESGGNADARSPYGAVGLMQVMPATGAKIAAERGEKDYDPKKLAEPAYNLDAGAWYLAQQMKEFGSVEQAAAAYNGGPKAIRTNALSEETIAYRALVGALWTDRESDRSIALYGWRDRALQRMSARTVDPLPGAKVSLPFQAMTPDFGVGAKPHEGLDLAIASGTEIHAPLGGRVTRAVAGDGDAGTVVVLDHGNGIETRYHHLGTLAVKAGDKIEAGAVVGTVGTSGKTTGPHLHLEVRDLGRPVDPLLVLPSPWRETRPSENTAPLPPPDFTPAPVPAAPPVRRGTQGRAPTPKPGEPAPLARLAPMAPLPAIPTIPMIPNLEGLESLESFVELPELPELPEIPASADEHATPTPDILDGVEAPEPPEPESSP